MMRNAVLAVGAALLVLALAVVAVGGPLALALWPGTVGIAILGGTLFERGRYKPAEDSSPGAGWEATDEHFLDPQTGDEVSVFYRRTTGERRYVKRRNVPAS